MVKILLQTCWVGLGGFLGANARYWLDRWVSAWAGVQFPWGTFVINVTGSFILGLFATLCMEKLLAPHWRLLVSIGFVGAYTTFSTFELDTFKLAESGSLWRALANVLCSVLAGFLAVWVGVKLARSF